MRWRKTKHDIYQQTSYVLEIPCLEHLPDEPAHFNVYKVSPNEWNVVFFHGNKGYHLGSTQTAKHGKFIARRHLIKLISGLSKLL